MGPHIGQEIEMSWLWIEARLTCELLEALSGADREDGEITGPQDHDIIHV